MYSTLFVFGLLLLLLPTASAYCEEVISKYSLKYYPNINITDVPCEPTKWLDTYKNASYVGMITVDTSNLSYNGNWMNAYEEKINFKGSTPQHLFTTYRSLIRNEQYIITSNADGYISSCMGFAKNDGEASTRALLLDDSHTDLIDKLFEWAKLYKKSDLVKPKC